MIGNRWQQKPPVGTQIDPGHPLAAGLVWHAPLNEGTGTRIADIVGGVNLSTTGSPVWAPGSTIGLSCAGTAGNIGASATLPASLKLSQPLTLVIALRRLGVTVQYSPLLGLFPNNTYASPNACAGIHYATTNGALQIQVLTSSGEFTANVGYVLGTADSVLVFTLGNGASNNVNLYVNGLVKYSVTKTLALSYSSPAELLLGTYQPTAGYTANSLIYWASIYNRELPAAFIQEYLSTPGSINQVYKPWPTFAASEIPASFSCSPTSMFADNPSGVNFSLSGYKSNWAPGTPGSPAFSLSGVSGASIASQSISSPTAATIHVATGVGSGNLSVSDGTLTASNTVTVLPVTFSVTPTTIPANHSGNITLAVTGAGTSWVNGTTTFSVSGVAGVTKVSQTVSSATAATVVITTGAGTGTLSVSDGVLTATTAVVATTFAMSVSSGLYRVPVSVTATGSVGSLWTRETAATLFTTPGTHGDSISSITVVSDTSATFTLNPGTTPQGNLVITETANGATQNYAIAGPSSLHIYGTGAAGGWTASTAANNLLSNQTSASYCLLFQLNSYGSTFSTFIGNAVSALVEAAGLSTFNAFVTDTTFNLFAMTSYSFVPGVVYHIAMTWDGVNHVQKFYINGQLLNSSNNTNGTRNANAATTVGWSNSTAADFLVQDIAIWNGYALTSSDVLKLRDSVWSPHDVSTPATTWWPYYGTQGIAPAITDPGLKDALGSNHFTTFSSTPTSAIAKYDKPLVYTAPAATFPYITKSGQNAVFGFAVQQSTKTTISGTVSVNSGSSSLTTSVPQAGWNGNQLRIAGDSSATTYTVVRGYAKSWTINPVYAGSANAVAAVATLVTNAPSNVNTVASVPTISAQWGGSGSFHNVRIGGPHFSPLYSFYPWVMFPLECGYVESVVLQSGGSSYVAPTIAASGGGGTGATFGSVLTGGVTSFTGLVGGSGYTQPTATIPAPQVVIPTPTIAITGTLTAGSTSVTGISSTTGMVPGMLVTGATGVGTTIATVVSSTAITLAAPAVYTGSTAMVAYGKQALAVATVSGGVITGVTVFCPGSGYTGSTLTASITAAPGYAGSGGSVTCHISNVIGAVSVTSPGSGYTSPPTIAVSDSGGSGAILVPLMGGFTAADVVQYTAADSWAVTAAGGCAAASSTPMVNYVGTLEAGFGGIYGFNLPSNQRTLPMGINITQTYNYSENTQNTTNWLNRTYGLQSQNTLISRVDPGGKPLTIQGTSATPSSLNFCSSQANDYDYAGFPTPVATGINGRLWIVVADETNPGANRMAVAITANSNTAAGYPSGEGYTAGTAATGVTAIAIGSGGNGYTSSPTVTITDPNGVGATAYAKVNATGQVVWITVTAVGQGYSATIPPKVVFSGGGGTNATATATTGNVTVGSVWKFTVKQTSATFNSGLKFSFWSLSKTSGTPVAYPYTLTNECIFSPQTSAAAYPAIPDRATAHSLDASMETWFTSPTPKYPAIVRTMNCVNVFAGGQNTVDASDLRDPGQYAWYGGQLATTSTTPTLAQNPTFSRTIPISTVRTYSISPSCVSAITVTTVGSGYSGTIPITFAGGGSFATGYATVTGGVVQNPVTITNGGSGYIAGGTTASAGYGAASATLSVTVVAGVVTAATVVFGGTGYLSYLPVTITDASGTGATAIATVSAAGTICGGTIETVDVGSGGTGYSSAPVVTIGGTGTTVATCTANIFGGSIVGFTIVKVGNGYTDRGTVTLSGGGGTGASATTTAGGVEVTAGGSGYVSPSATIGGGGSGVVLAVAVGYPSGVVSGIVVTAAGSGYTSAPAVAITGDGTGATAIAVLGSGTVIGFTILSVGSGYTHASVALSGGGGTGAAATAKIWNVTWSSPKVYLPNPGTGTATAVTTDPTWTGYGATSPVSGGPYQVSPLSPAFTNLYQAPVGGTYCGEMITSAPHNLKTGQEISISGTARFSVSTGPKAATTFATTAGGNYMVWVTGPTSFAFAGQANDTDAGFGIPGHFNTVSGSFAVDYTATIVVPDAGTMPYSVVASMIGDLPGTNIWINLPIGATDACLRVIAAQVRDNFPMGRKVWVEFGNEHFNIAFNISAYVPGMGLLGAWSSQSLNSDTGYVERASQAHAIFISVFNQTDVNGNSNRGGEIVRVFGSFMVEPAETQAMVSYANANAKPMDAVCVAHYFDPQPEDTSPNGSSAESPTVGTFASSGGTLPAGTYYFSFTWVDSITSIESTVGASESNFTITLGVIPSITLPAFPSWGTGTINLYLTQAGGASGSETLYSSGIAPGATVTIPAGFSAGVSPPAYNLMPSLLSAAANLATHWPTSIAYKGANPRSRASYLEYLRHIIKYQNGQNNPLSLYVQHQTALNTYSVGSNPTPLLAGYEGAIESMVPGTLETGANPLPNGTQLRTAIAQDVPYDPAMYDTENTYYELSQQGGLAVMNHFNLGAGSYGAQAGDGSGTVSWPYMLWAEQPFGRGDGTGASNGVAITNQFWGDIQFSPHSQNSAVRMKAWNDWVDQTSQFVIPGDVYVTPANGSSSVSSRVVIVVQFDEPMLASTITNSTWTLAIAGNLFTGKISYNPLTWAATFAPTAPLNSLATYTVQLTTGVQNAQGIALPNPITWSFTTAKENRPALRWFPGLIRQTLRGY